MAGNSSSASTSNRGFASMDEEKQKEIASKGGQAAHESGNAHEFSSEEAREAGRLGGESRGGSQQSSSASSSSDEDEEVSSEEEEADDGNSNSGSRGGSSQEHSKSGQQSGKNK